MKFHTMDKETFALVFEIGIHFVVSKIVYNACRLQVFTLMHFAFGSKNLYRRFADQDVEYTSICESVVV